jgi:hypothetical protein
MGVGVSIFTITLGLILKFAIAEDAMTDPVDIHVIGVILIIVGGASFALQLLLMSRMQQRGLGPAPNGRLARDRDNGRDRDAPYDPDSRPPV